ncbi:FAD-dependent oxidoreductase [Nocardioides sp.]|uniref:FAD-dependent oxidoreductase n=1 Tax=Nocardioides sp. TaxID=35761 RepID=UPI003566E5D6
MTLATTAVVLGGSVAGLCAAGALAPHVEEVVVLERDVLPADAEHRRGVPQSKHPHFLLNAGRRSIGTLFPGFEDDLIAAGGMPLMPSLDAAYLEETGWAPRKRSTMTMIYSSRILIERVLRDRVRALPNVTIREGVAVQGLEFSAPSGPGSAVTGVRLQAGDGPSEVLAADLVVDALGRGSSVADWIESAGWPAVPVKTLDAKVTYISRWYDLPPESERPDSWWWRHLIVMPTQDDARDRPAEHSFLSNFFPLENGRAIACMGSWGLEMPRTVEDFTASAERLRTPVFADAMKRSTPTSEVHLTRSTGNKWRRYDQLPTPPRGLVFIGDSICAFNPFYGQGMSSAARSAVQLQGALEDATSLDGSFAGDFLREQVATLDVPWKLAMARDQGFECATGTESLPSWQRRIVAAMTWPVFNTITGAAREDQVIDEHFARVFNLDETLGEMFRSPRVLFGLARHQVKAALGRTTVPFGFDPLLDPPATDYSEAAPTEKAEALA